MAIKINVLMMKIIAILWVVFFEKWSFNNLATREIVMIDCTLWQQLVWRGPERSCTNLLVPVMINVKENYCVEKKVWRSQRTAQVVS